MTLIKNFKEADAQGKRTIVKEFLINNSLYIFLIASVVIIQFLHMIIRASLSKKAIFTNSQNVLFCCFVPPFATGPVRSGLYDANTFSNSVEFK